MLNIGIDPGKFTGFAEWHINAKIFTSIKTLQLHEALIELKKHIDLGLKIKVYMEDARKRKWFGKNANQKQQGAGSIKRDCTIIEDACKDWGIELVLIDPKNLKGLTKLSQEQFQKITGYNSRTSQHGRDAAMMVYNK